MKTFKSKLHQKAMLSVPVYEDHKRGKNWLASIQKDPSSPGGLARNFCKKGCGEYYYIIEDLKENTAIDGADYYTGGGNPRRDRWYGVVTEITEDVIKIKQYETSAKAIKAVQKISEKQEDEEIKIENPLLKYTDQSLIDELERRGITGLVQKEQRDEKEEEE
jgi:hypothetical protein